MPPPQQRTVPVVPVAMASTSPAALVPMVICAAPGEDYDDGEFESINAAAKALGTPDDVVYEDKPR